MNLLSCFLCLLSSFLFMNRRILEDGVSFELLGEYRNTRGIVVQMFSAFNRGEYETPLGLIRGLNCLN